MPEYTEPEEKGGNFNPLNERVNEKTYSKLNVTANAESLNRPIQEPFFTPPPMNENVTGEKTTTGAGSKSGPAAQQDAFNPSMNEIPAGEKAKASEHVAAMIMQGYEFANQMANKGLLFSEKRLMKLQQAGEIDLVNTAIPYDMEGRMMSAAEFIKEYNEQQQDAFKVTDEFKAEVTPVLTRVLQKRGVGMTDEQFLMYMFGKDIAIKGVQFFAARSQMNQIIGMMKEANASGASPVPPPPAPSQPTYSNPVQQQPIYEEGEEEWTEINPVPFAAETANETVERMTNPEAYAAKHSATQVKPKKKVGRPKKGSKKAATKPV